MPHSNKPVRPVESSALAMAPLFTGDENIMPYKDRLKRWVVVRLLPEMQRIDVERFYSYSDADGYIQTLRRLDPTAELLIMFDPGMPKKQ